MTSKQVLLINAYSADNSGDGLLVDLAIALVQRTFGEDTRITVSATDVGSFGYLEEIDLVCPLDGRAKMRQALSGIACVLSSGRSGMSREFKIAVDQADCVLSVGGGYLRGGRPLEAFKSFSVHLSQMVRVVAEKKRWGLLPQSIGPYKAAPLRLALSSVLQCAAFVCVRDDQSEYELSSLGNLHRLPDHALLTLPSRRFARSARAAGKSVAKARVGIVLRSLAGEGSYRDSVRSLLRSGITFVSLLQSETGGRNNDKSFYEEVGLEVPSLTLKDAVQGRLVDAVISVRLHGAMQAVLEGVPAIHLSYERKGYSAYSDLGLSDFVFNARRFDASAVVAALKLILDQPESSYWTHVDDNLTQLSGAVEELDELVLSLDDGVAR